MRVLGLVSSPRKLGNSEILVKEMFRVFPDAEKSLIRLPDLDIQACRACYACLAPDKSCIIPDDLSFLLNEIKKADAVIIAAPCYFLGTHTSIKLVSDRLISVMQNGSEFQGKKCVAAVTYGVPGWEGYAREAVMSFARFLHLDLAGIMTVQAANPGAVIRSEIIEQARNLAARLMNEQQADNTPVHTCAICGSSLLQLSVTGTVRCVLCNATGRIHLAEGAVSIKFEEPDHRRFSPEGIAEHGELLEAIKEEYIAKRKDLMAARKAYQQFDDCWLKPADRA